MADKKTHTSKSKITSRQVVAMAGIVLLVLLYVATLAVAIVDRSASARWFWICLFATVAIPLLIWIYTRMYGKLTGKGTFADPRPENPGTQNAEANNDFEKPSGRSE